MKITLLKVTTKTDIFYFQVNSKDDMARCVISSDYNKIFPGPEKALSWQALLADSMLSDDVEDYREIV